MKVYLDSIGCRLNQSEIEKYAGQFRAAGHTVVSDPAEADLVVVNTCAVTAEAASDSRQKIRQAARAGAASIVVTGCWSTLEPAAALQLPQVSQVVTNLEKDQLVPGLLHLPEELFDREPIAREPLPGAHLRTRAFIKVQDGCDNHCTFCVTRIARGPGRSRSVEQVLADIRAAQAGGSQEIVLTGVHLGSWGQDFHQPRHLRHLIETVLAHSDVPRVRLSSLEPWDLDESFFSLWQDERLCRQLHLPLQSGCEATLRRMARKTTPTAFARLVEQARAAAADMAITTDMIVGFPGETGEEFQQSLAFARQMEFAGGHVFSYSGRPGTPALKLGGQIAPAVRKVRSATLRAAIEESARRFRLGFVGQEAEVLWEAGQAREAGGWRLEGLSSSGLRIASHHNEPRWNKIDRVRLDCVTDSGLEGTLLD